MVDHSWLDSKANGKLAGWLTGGKMNAQRAGLPIDNRIFTINFHNLLSSHFFLPFSNSFSLGFHPDLFSFPLCGVIPTNNAPSLQSEQPDTFPYMSSVFLIVLELLFLRGIH